MHKATRYIVEIRPDGSETWTPLSTESLLQIYWLPDAPFSYDQFVDAMEDHNKMRSGTWISFEMRGNRLTASHQVAACYESLHAYGCLPEMNYSKVAELFNSIGANIKTAKILKCNCRDACDFYHSVFRSLPDDRR